MLERQKGNIIVGGGGGGREVNLRFAQRENFLAIDMWVHNMSLIMCANPWFIIYAILNHRNNVIYNCKLILKNWHQNFEFNLRKLHFKKTHGSQLFSKKAKNKIQKFENLKNKIIYYHFVTKLDNSINYYVKCLYGTSDMAFLN